MWDYYSVNEMQNAKRTEKGVIAMVPFLKNDVPTFADISAESNASAAAHDVNFSKALRRVAAYIRKAERSFTTVAQASMPTSF